MNCIDSLYVNHWELTGGSLTKIAYYSTVPYRKVLYNKDQKAVDSEVCG